MDDTILLVILFLGFMYFKSNDCGNVHGNSIVGNGNMYQCQVYQYPSSHHNLQGPRTRQSFSDNNLNRHQLYNKQGWYLPN